MPESFISTRNHAWTLVVFLVPYEMEKRKKPSGITINLFVTLESVLFVVGRGVFFDSQYFPGSWGPILLVANS